MEALVTLVLEGKGGLLLNKETSPSTHPEVLEFLTNVPAYMAKIASIHSAANNGNLRELQSLLDRKRLALARDENGRVALHMAVLGGCGSTCFTQFDTGIQIFNKHFRRSCQYCALPYPELWGAGWLIEQYLEMYLCHMDDDP